MAFYSYKMTRDFGFAPNPFGGICTLATCKPHIRNKANVGDWIIGNGSKEINLSYNRLIYVMKVTEKLPLDLYWSDPRFQFKKPILNGSLITIHGDNVYTKDNDENWIQEKCHHTHHDVKIREKHIKNDTKGGFVLISDCFYYFGDKNFQVPNEYQSVCSNVRDYLSPQKLDNELCEKFIEWIEQSYPRGINGFPIHWKEYSQLDIFKF
jgi:hypothetical protein